MPLISKVAGIAFDTRLFLFLIHWRPIMAWRVNHTIEILPNATVRVKNSQRSLSLKSPCCFLCTTIASIGQREKFDTGTWINALLEVELITYWFVFLGSAALCKHKLQTEKEVNFIQQFHSNRLFIQLRAFPGSHHRNFCVGWTENIWLKMHPKTFELMPKRFNKEAVCGLFLWYVYMRD